MPFAHIGPVPVEELLPFAPVVLTAAGGVAALARRRMRELMRARRPARGSGDAERCG